MSRKTLSDARCLNEMEVRPYRESDQDAVAADFRKRGFGRLLMDEAEARLREMGCPKVSLQIRRSNADVVAFYRSIGYAEDDVVSMGKRLIED